MSLRSRASFVVSSCARAWSSHSDGSAVCCSSSAACDRLTSTSKELLRGGDALGQLAQVLGVIAHGSSGD
jgi:hypothetical protein